MSRTAKTRRNSACRGSPRRTDHPVHRVLVYLPTWVKAVDNLLKIVDFLASSGDLGVPSAMILHAQLTVERVPDTLPVVLGRVGVPVERGG